MTQMTIARCMGLLALVTVACSAQAQGPRRPIESPTGPNIPMDINLNSPSYENQWGEEDADFLSTCSILPGNFVGMKKALALKGNSAYYDALTEAGPSYAEYYVAAHKDQNTATNIFRTACKINHGVIGTS